MQLRRNCISESTCEYGLTTGYLSSAIDREH